jgi:hypothetical protein
MLGPGRYLLGVVELALLVGFAWLGAVRVRSRLAPGFAGAPAHLGTSVVALALLIWVAELLGTVSLFKPVPYLLAVALVGVGLRWAIQAPPTTPPAKNVVGGSWIATGAALLVAAIAVVHFAAGVKTRLSTGMTGFDSTWYHGPFAAGFFQSANTIDLHFIAPQFLSWFYPANGEIFHAIGMLAFGRDLLSPLLNLGWFAGCLLAAWCIGRPYRVAPWSLALAAIALSVPALSDQAGEARNDIVGIFFLLAAVAIALNAWRGEGVVGDPAPTKRERSAGLSTGALLVSGLAAGLAAGTKLNFLLPAAVLVIGLAVIVPRGARAKALAASGLAALAGGDYWYLRNLVHTGNPLPWIHHLGPISLPAPEQGLGGSEAHSVFGYLTDGSVWSDWFLPGLHSGLWLLWPLLLTGALLGLVLSLAAPAGWWASNTRRRGISGPSTSGLGPERASGVGGEPASDLRMERVLALAGAVGSAAALAWLVSPTSASGRDGMPHGFESGLRYLAPAFVLGLALLPAVPPLRRTLASIGRGHDSEVRQSFVADSATKVGRSAAVRQSFGTHSVQKVGRTGRRPGSRVGLAVLAAILVAAIAAGYPIQRHYLENRYANPTFTTPGLDAAFKWARGVSGSRIATTSTRQYPLFGTDLSNHVEYLGVDRPHGGFEEIKTCRAWREALDAGDYDYAVTTFDRLEPSNPPFPPQATWTEGPHAEVVLRRSPTVVFKITAPLNPSTCPN